MAKNELTTTTVDQFPALQQDSGISEMIVANAGEGAGISPQDLTTVPTPSGGGTTWQVPTIAGDEPTDELVGILAYQGVYGSLWPSEDPVEGTPPVLITRDLRVARRIGDDLGDLDEAELEKARRPDGLYDWKALSYTQMGTGKRGIGKRAKEGRIWALLRPGDVLPTILRIGPGSASKAQSFLMQLVNARVFYWQAVVGVSLKAATSKGGQRYSQHQYRLVERLTPEQGELIKATYTDVLEGSLGEEIVAGGGDLG